MGGHSTGKECVNKIYLSYICNLHIMTDEEVLKLSTQNHKSVQ